MLNFKKTLTTLVLAGSLLCNTSHADIIISGTRIIYDENKKDVSIRLENKGTRPLLVELQALVDSGGVSPRRPSQRAAKTAEATCSEGQALPPPSIFLIKAICG